MGEKSSQDAARAFGYTAGSFQVLCHQFRRDPEPAFFVASRKGPKAQPRKDSARGIAVSLRKRNYSVYDISRELKEMGLSLSPSAVGELLAAEGFAPLPRRLDEERPVGVHPTVEAVADVADFSLEPREFTTRCGGLFLFVPELVRLGVDGLASSSRLPGSKMIPASHALRASLALKLWSIERKSHIMALVADQGLALFSGLNITPKKSYLSEYSSRIDHRKTLALLTGWHKAVGHEKLFTGESMNLDFHSVPYFGEDPCVQRHFVAMRSRRQPSVLAFLAQDASSRTFCYSNADLRKGEEAEEVLRFLEFWQKVHRRPPEELVFDSKLTTYSVLGQLDDMPIRFLTLRRRTKPLLEQIADLPKSAWRTIELDVPTRKFRFPRIHESTVRLEGHKYRQLFVLDLGHEEPTILLTNHPRKVTAKRLLTRYAQRMLIENALSDAVRFFHMNALSSAVGLKVDFDMALLVIASGLYRILADKMRGYDDAQARQVFRDLIDTPANIRITESDVVVTFHRRAHLPILASSGMFDRPVPVPWWNSKNIVLTA